MTALADIKTKLAEAAYIADDSLAMALQLAIDLGRQIRQTAVQHGLAPPGHDRQSGRHLLEGRQAVAHVIGVGRRNRGQIVVAGGTHLGTRAGTF